MDNIMKELRKFIPINDTMGYKVYTLFNRAMSHNINKQNSLSLIIDIKEDKKYNKMKHKLTNFITQYRNISDSFTHIYNMFKYDNKPNIKHSSVIIYEKVLPILYKPGNHSISLTNNNNCDITTHSNLKHLIDSRGLNLHIHNFKVDADNLKLGTMDTREFNYIYNKHRPGNFIVNLYGAWKKYSIFSDK